VVRDNKLTAESDGCTAAATTRLKNKKTKSRRGFREQRSATNPQTARTSICIYMYEHANVHISTTRAKCII